MKLFTSKLSAVLLSACMVLPVLSNGATVSCNNTAIAAETADAAIKFNNEDQFFVYVGTYGGSIPQFRYLYPTSDGSYNADKVIWEEAPTGLAYGDIFVADGDVPMTQVYPAADDPANAHVYYYTLDEGTELSKAGNCTDIMEKKDLSVTSKTYDGSSHWSVRYMDAAGEKYYYGVSRYASDLIVDPLDCEVGDIYTYALYNDYMVVPLEKKENATANELYFNTQYGYVPVEIGLYTGAELVGYDDGKFYEVGDSPIEFTIDDEKIAKLGPAQGIGVNVLGVSVGETMLNAKTPDGRTASIRVVVKEAPSTSTTAVWNHETTTTTTTASISYGIGVSQLPDKTVYQIGEELDLTGLRLNGSYTEGDLVACIMDEDYRNVPITVDASEFDNTKAGTYTIYILYGNAKDSFTVDVVDDLPAGATRITLYDKDTGELIPNEVLEANPFKFHADIVYTPNLFSTVGATTGIADYTVTTNEAILDECYLCPELSSLAMAYKKADTFNITTEEQPEITYYDNGSMDIVFKLKFTPTGDVNDDGEFNVADVVLLQKWLLAVPDTHLANWKAVDFCNDNRLNVFDLCLMKRELIRTTVTTYVEPDHRSTYGAPLYVVKDGLNLYLGPDGSYASIATLPEGTQLHELGYNDNNYNWLFTEYNGQYGWIRTYEDDNKTRTVEYLAQPDKPVIYLYPEEETDVHVELELTEADLSTTYPKYNNGWDVVAYPDGTLLNKADGTHHKYLFWDAVNCRTRFDFSKGFCVAGSDTESFLKEKLTYMGLTEQEMNEFIVYWLPRMEHNAYNLISFQGDAYTNSAKLTITPTPDSECRIFMAYVPLDAVVDIEPQVLSTFERKGFTVVEWGGAEIKTGNN